MRRPRYLIRFHGDYAVRFHTNVGGRCFSLVADADASLFAEPDEALDRAIQHGMAPGDAALRLAEEESPVERSAA